MPVCPGCKNDVHPLRVMTVGGDSGVGGGFGGFVDKCPKPECGVLMPPVEAVTVSGNAAEEIELIEAELHALEVEIKAGNDEDQTASAAAKELRLRLYRLKNPIAHAAPAMPAAAPIAVVVPTAAVVAKSVADTPAIDLDIVSTLRARLATIVEQRAKLEREERTILKMLAITEV